MKWGHAHAITLQVHVMHGCACRKHPIAACHAEMHVRLWCMHVPLQAPNYINMLYDQLDAHLLGGTQWGW